MKKLGQLYRLINVLSLDIVAGAIISAEFFAHVFHVHLLSPGLAALGLTVWVIYTVDHLVDARRSKGTASTIRHRFHQDYFGVLVGLVIVAAGVDGAVLLKLRPPVLYSGILLATAVLGYLLFQRKLRFVKELFGALLYTSGVMLPALSLSTKMAGFSQVWIGIEFFLTVISNLLLFSLFGRQQDMADRHTSFSTVLGGARTQSVLRWLLFVNVLLLGLQLAWRFEIAEALALVLMNADLIIILAFRPYFEVNDRYRMWGDVIFLFPAILLIA